MTFAYFVLSQIFESLSLYFSPCNIRRLFKDEYQGISGPMNDFLIRLQRGLMVSKCLCTCSFGCWLNFMMSLHVNFVGHKLSYVFIWPYAGLWHDVGGHFNFVLNTHAYSI